ncbi:MAG TPA: hypothetical protein VM120_23875 [Bryobacteraceae bacterium]|nr:hypothetical protein [Bryobacteraceae bacterium]
MRWVTAQDLQSWAGRLDAESRLPELVRRLVHATVDTPQKVAFPSGESVQTGGWDGIVSTTIGNAYVPDGSSGWELSKRADIKTKADDDYQKRTADPEHLDRAATTYVFLTPRRWNQKEDWIAEKKAKAEWADIRAYDADDLEQWLEHAPAVSAWLARILHKYPSGVSSIDDLWAEYSFGTSPTFTPGMLLAGRKEDAEAAVEWLKNGSGTLRIAADSPREALAFMAASITSLSAEEQVELRSRFLSSEDPTVLRELLTTANHLVIGWVATDTASVGIALQQGHRVILPTRADQQPTITLARPDQEELSSALKAVGLDEDKATALVRESGDSITVLHRRLSTAPAPPSWAAPEHARELLPAVLANAWDEQCDSDKAILAGLGAAEYHVVVGAMARWSHAADAPVQQTGTVWTLRAPRDAWHLLNTYLTGDDIERLRTAITNVLALDDPSLDLAPQERWLANVHGKDFPHSPWLRRGLAHTIIQIALTSTIGGQRGSDIAARIVHDTLQGNWRRWYSLEPVLPLLAEAAPAAFIATLEQFLDTPAPGLENLILTVGPMHGDHASGLWWALELLAWYPEHLARVVLLLARLAHNHKRSKDVLRAIFLTWRPQTGATIEARATALGVLLQRDPDVTWELLLDLWPKLHDVGSQHYEPRWRPKPITRPITVGEHVRAANAVVQLALDATNNDPQRLTALLQQVSTAPPDARARLREQLTAFARDEHDADRRLLVWNAVREETTKYRHFADADWALPEAEVALFDPITSALTPADPVSRHSWIFEDSHPMLPTPGIDYHRDEDALTGLRTQALRDVFIAGGADRVRELATKVKQPYLVGIAAASADIADDVLLPLLASPQESVQLCARGFAYERCRTCGMAWVDQTLASHAECSALSRALLLLAAPSERTTWDRVQAQGVTAEYWSRFRACLRPGTTADDIAFAIGQLLAAGQVAQAFDQAAIHAEETPTPTLIATLELVLEALQDPDAKVGQVVGYDVVQILGVLDTRDDIDIGRIAAYEWAFLPVLRDQRNLRLHEHLANAPDLFAQMIKSIYRPANGQPRKKATKEEEARARHAYELLSSWHTIPGTTPDGSIDEEQLLAWARAARSALPDHWEAGDDQFGHVVAWSPAAPDGLWPHESVRALIEQLASTPLDDGFCAGVFNKRGVFMRNPFEGGVQERALGAQYRGWGEAVAPASPRTAAALFQIADGYDRQAHREDVRAQQFRLER